MTTTKPPIVIVRRELRPSESNETFGSIIDTLLELDHIEPIAVTIDLRTPSSASSQALLVTFRDTPAARQAIADFFYDELDDLDFV